MRTRVIHVNDMPNHPDAVYIGRANGRKRLPDSVWRNPYVIGVDGSREDVIEQYETMMRRRIEKWSSQYDLLCDLAGKPLACWCRRDGEERTMENACHGDVLCDLLVELGLEGEGEA